MISLDYGVQLVTRAEWGAAAPTSVTPLNPSFGATRHWEGPHMGPFPHSSCATKVRGIQAFHMGPARGWTDIAYTGVVCPHGYVFEGRGLFRRTAANGTNVGNNTAYAFCYLGGIDDPFTEDGKRAMRAAMNWTRQHGGAGPGRNDHNDWKNTLCPGTEIEAWGDGGEPIQWTPPTPEEEDDDMPYLLRNGQTGAIYLMDPATGPVHLINSTTAEDYSAVMKTVRCRLGSDADWLVNRAAQIATADLDAAADLEMIRADLADEEPSSPPG